MLDGQCGKSRPGMHVEPCSPDTYHRKHGASDPHHPSCTRGQAARLLCRCRSRRGSGREGPRAVRRADLRPQADRAQHPCGEDARVQGRHLRRGDRGGAAGRDRGLLRTRRRSRGPRPGRRTPPPHHRRDLPAGHQGAQRGQALRRPGLRHPAHRPRRSRRGRRHVRRGTAEHSAGRRPRRRRQGQGPRPGEARLALPDHALRGRDHRDRQQAARALPQPARPAQRRHLLRHPEPPGRGEGDRRPVRAGDRGGLHQLLQLRPPGRGGPRRGRERLLPGR